MRNSCVLFFVWLFGHSDSFCLIRLKIKVDDSKLGWDI